MLALNALEWLGVDADRFIKANEGATVSVGVPASEDVIAASEGPSDGSAAPAASSSDATVNANEGEVESSPAPVEA